MCMQCMCVIIIFRMIGLEKYTVYYWLFSLALNNRNHVKVCNLYFKSIYLLNMRMCSSASSFLRVYSYTGEVSSIFGIIGGTWSLANAYTQKQNI